jgi:hypothetical protein
VPLQQLVWAAAVPGSSCTRQQLYWAATVRHNQAVVQLLTGMQLWCAVCCVAQGIKVMFIAAGSAAVHCIAGDVNGVCYTWGRNEVGGAAKGRCVCVCVCVCWGGMLGGGVYCMTCCRGPTAGDSTAV